MKKTRAFLKHLLFITAIAIFPLGYNIAYEEIDNYRTGYGGIRYMLPTETNFNVSFFLGAVGVSVIIIFFLWKYDYFTKKRHL